MINILDERSCPRPLLASKTIHTIHTICDDGIDVLGYSEQYSF